MSLNFFTITSKITYLVRSGRISCARKMFDEMPMRDSVAWNAMITAYSQLGLHQESLSLFAHMRISDVLPDHFTMTAALTACAGAGELLYGTKVHTLVYVLGYQHHTAVSNSLIDLYGKCLSPSCANKVFEEMGIRNEVSWCSLLYAHVNCSQFDSANEVFNIMPERVKVAWNTLMAGYAKHGKVELCLELFKQMRASSFEPDEWTLSSLMHSCSESLKFQYGSMVHAYIIKSGWESAAESRNSILSFYSKLCFRDDVMKMLESFGTLTSVSWNTVIDAHMKSGDTARALLAFREAPDKNIISWTTMISGFVRNGQGEQALAYFVSMVRTCTFPDYLSLGSVLLACSSLAAVGYGEMIHSCVISYGFQDYVYVGNGLVNMYAKCGDIERSRHAFDEIIRKDLVSWNTMLFGFGIHGQAIETFELFEEMVACGARPDKVTFIGLLMTCSHLGLLEKAQALSNAMLMDHGLRHEEDHLACMIDMLGRAGYLSEARELVDEIAAGTSALEALLGACSVHDKTDMGMASGESLKNLEPTNEMGYVMLSNLYCASGNWRAAEMVRRAMVDNGVKKAPGCSWVEVRNSVMAFVAGNNSHFEMAGLYIMLNFLDLEMRHTCTSSGEFE
ncbi:hypothetical protein SAY86_007510 [Trapa natans]|uniref:Pentatricopeptide repeat-containing protein n=1 Tax=Trapa natans TaxID=22666 RepID=A0AAN7R0H3_TRANT|nr:hypothetical protein SAY86_007510 [Trapa natans]